MKANNTKIKKAAYVLFFPLAVFYMEMVLMNHCYDELMGWGVFYTFMFSVVFGLGVLFISSLFKKTAGHIISCVLMGLITLYMGIQAVYFTIFKTFTTLSQFDMAGDALSEFGKETINGIQNSIVTIILLVIPLILLIIFGRRFRSDTRIKFKPFIAMLTVLIAFQVMGTQFVYANTAGVMSYKYVYTGSFSPILSVPRFGALTTLRFEVQNMLFGNSSNNQPNDKSDSSEPAITDKNDADSSGDITDNSAEPVVVEYGDNVLEIDFDALIANESSDTIKDMHEYFSNREPTGKNEYTGMYEGYNLVWIVAEGFSRYAVSETYTPTLYKMANEGFVFENFYNPIWGVSTSDGEYTTMTGLLPKSGVRSFSESSKIYMAYGFGNLLTPYGYKCRAYHDHTYTYYNRNESHPNLGYDYKGVGNGLDVESVWPESDVEMMQKTIPEYINDELFHTYYMTVSGHLEYNFMGNTQAYRHKSEVQSMLDAGYSEAASAYVACQMEFDQSVEYLIQQLKEAGKLDNTLIVISGDHYPYGLTVEQMEELAGGDIEENFELYRTTLIIWNSAMTETVKIDKYCSSLDVMPTILNLLGVDYDSRLIMGQDILSDSAGFIEFNNKSYISELGRYNSQTDEFIPNEGVTVPEGYAAEMLEYMNDEFYYSAKILENDYYAKVFKNE